MALIDVLAKLADRYEEIERRLADPEVSGRPSLLADLLREHGGLEKKVAAYRDHRRVERELSEAREVLGTLKDRDEQALFREEVERLEAELERVNARVREAFVLEDENAHRDVILEIRAGTGGDEAALFAGDLLRMYSAYAATRGWGVEILDLAEGGVGGVREVVVNVTGKGVFRRLRYESGGHRVQRVPATETQGRVHTSAATVAVLPEASRVEVDIRDQDLRIDTFRSSGPGGQSVNKTSSAIRITHEPSGLVVSCQDEKSQHKNKAKALKILASRLYELEQSKIDAQRSSTRRALIGSGDRSERIRTYNFPQNRVTDHRINLSLHSLDRVMEGELDPLIDPLLEHDKELRLRSLDDQESTT